MVPAAFNGADWGEEAVPDGFNTAWLAWLDETDPDCPGGVVTSWLETGGFDTARDGTGAAADET